MREILLIVFVLGLVATTLYAQQPAADLAQKMAEGIKGRVVLVPAGKGTAESLFADTTPTVLDENAEGWRRDGAHCALVGAYTNGRIRVPFRRAFVPGFNPMAVTETADFSGLPKEYLVAEHALVLPLVVAKDEHDRMLAFGGEGRVEMFRMDMNDVDHRAQSISDNRGFQPYWDIGRVLQLPTGFVISRANHADTPNYVVDGGRSAPGWADYSERGWGVTVRVLDPAKSAPWALMIDARKGELVVSPRPADQPPVSGADCGKRDFAFGITRHEGSWPAAYPCELPADVYTKLLAWLNQGTGFTHLAYACGNIGVTPAKDKDTLYRNIVFRDRVPPSVLLRIFYRADAWRMSQIATQLLGRSVGRNQPFEQWEKIAQEVLEKLRKDGVPEPK